MTYQITEYGKKKSAETLWQSIRNGLTKEVIVKSISSRVYYTVYEVTKDAIRFSVPTRNQGNAEIISFNDFVMVLARLQKEQQFNTSSARELFKGTRIYKKRSPFFAILLASGIIEKGD